MPTIAASHAMSLVATGAVDEKQAEKLARTFEKNQRAKFKEGLKEAEKKKKRKLKAKTGKTKKEKMGKLLAALLDEDAGDDDSDTDTEDTSSTESESEPEESPPPKKQKSKAKKKTKKSSEVSFQPEPEEEPTDDETETVTSDFEAKMATMQAKMMADFEKKTAATVKLAVAKALEPKVLGATV